MTTFGATAQRRNGATAQRRNGATAQRRNGATAQRRNGATAQRRNGATAQRRNGAKAYWAKVRIADIFNRQDKPACAVARVDVANNKLLLDVVRVKEFEFDLPRTGLTLTTQTPLQIGVKLLDPLPDRFDTDGLTQVNETTPVTQIIVRGDFDEFGAASATGVGVVLGPDSITFSPLLITNSTEYLLITLSVFE